MSKFFKSDWFRCTAVLLGVILLAGALLTILSFLFNVTPEMRTERAIAKLYNGQKQEYSVKLDCDVDGQDKIIFDGVGSINKWYVVGDEMSNHDQLLQASGFDGYKGGTVTVWVKISVTDGVYSIKTVLLETFDKQTLMSKFGGDFYSKYQLTDITDNFNRGIYFSIKQGESSITQVVSGATKTSTAFNNAINCVIKSIGGGL